MANADSRRLRIALEHLALRKPQALLLEGGSEESRLAMSMYWAMLANCPSAMRRHADGQIGEPCGACSACRQIRGMEYVDLHIYDGRISNKQDEDNPGLVRALNMDNMHILKRLNATAPVGDGKRVAIFQGMGQTREEALNSLLKTLEEPTEHTLFVLLAPQRSQLLSTLVSRSFCLTLPWTGCLSSTVGLETWENALGGFLAGNTGFLEKIAAKGALDSLQAGKILISAQKAIGRILSGKPRPESSLDQAVAPLAGNVNSALVAQRWIMEALEMLAGTVTPARVLEAFAARMHILLRAV